jgi:hypothetical protein
VFTDLDPSINYPNEPTPIIELYQSLARSGGHATVLARSAPQRSRPHDALPSDRLATLGFRVEPLPVAPEYAVDRFRIPIVALRVSVDR